MTYKPDSAVKWIVVHYSATYTDADVSMQMIDRWHRERGFREIGYHYYITKDGKVWKGRDLSREGEFEVGAHSKGENSRSVAICYEGGLERETGPNVGKDTRTPEQTRAMISTIDRLKRRFPTAVVEGHRDMPGAATQCPGFNAAAWWQGVEASRIAPPDDYAPPDTPKPPKGVLAAFLAALVGFFAWRASK